VENVTVILQARGRGPHRTFTAKDGSFGLGIVGAKPENTTVTFEKSGYKSVQRPLGKEREAALDVTLEVEAGGPDHGPPSVGRDHDPRRP
jgi:hypothetical protein